MNYIQLLYIMARASLSQVKKAKDHSSLLLFHFRTTSKLELTRI
jgi:hypothetical protein